MDKHTLSLAMIVKNEEETLDRCLSSVFSVVDEIIIVDTGSTDKTKDIAKKYNAKIYDFEWIDDFSAARNFSFSKCTKSHILWLDADDVIKPIDAEKIKAQLKADFDALLCRYIYAHYADDTPQVVLKRHRIVKNSPKAKWFDPIHEYLATPFPNIKEVNIEVHHYRTANQYERSRGRNLRILKKLYKGSNDPRHEYYYARELADEGFIDDARKIFEKIVAEKKAWEGDIINAYQHLTKLYIAINESELAIETCFKAIQFNPHYVEIYNILAKIYYDKEDWRKTAQYSEMATTIEKPDAIHSYFPYEYDYIPYDRLIIAYFNLQQYEKSYKACLKALEGKPKGHDLDRCLFNKQLLEELLDRKKDGAGKKLNLGCGEKKIQGYVDVDVVNTPYTDEVFSIDNIPYQENTISAIYCEHVIEHLPHKLSEKAIQEMARVLQAGGELQLFLPDLELCCREYLQASNQTQINYTPDKQWYKYTIFGYQQDANGVDAQHQYHQTGYSKTEITELLEKNGFVIDYMENY